MKHIAAALSDVGKRESNQDSICVKIAKLKGVHDVVMAVICDGMGGLSKGELASATLIRAFLDWFEKELPVYETLSLENIADNWIRIIQKYSVKLKAYGDESHLRLGTTFSGLFILDGNYMILHIGDTRIYEIYDGAGKRLTEDQTLAMREYKEGNLTMEELMRDPRRSILLQCVGVTEKLKPEIRYGNVRPNSTFLLCSDGQYHTITDDDFAKAADPNHLNDIRGLRRCCETLIARAKESQETDNISLAVIKNE